MRRGAGEEIVLWLDLGGAFEGHTGTTPLGGKLSPDQLSILRELFNDERIAIYKQDALPTDGSVVLEGTAERPVFRVVVRDSSEPVEAGSEKLQAYFAEGAQRAETSRMLSEVKRLLAEEAQVP
jgi:ribosomal protein S16